MAEVLGQRVHQQVGRRADQGADAAHLRRVGERDQDLRGRHAIARRRRHDQGQEHGDRRGVVDEGRNDRDGQHHQQQEGPLPAHAREQAAERGEGTGALQARTEHEHGCDRNGGFVGEARDRVLRGHQAEDDEGRQRQDRDHVDGEFFAREQANRAGQHCEREDGVQAHISRAAAGRRRSAGCLRAPPRAARPGTAVRTRCVPRLWRCALADRTKRPAR